MVGRFCAFADEARRVPLACVVHQHLPYQACGLSRSFQAVAVAPEGLGLGEHRYFHFATAIVNGTGDVEFDSWLLEP
jgi:hypothetical protein